MEDKSEDKLEDKSEDKLEDKSEDKSPHEALCGPQSMKRSLDRLHVFLPVRAKKWSGLFLLFGKVLQPQKSSKQPQNADRPLLFGNRLKMAVKDDREFF